jgi:diguanylate cyclase (GGDEF)-like protein
MSQATLALSTIPAATEGSAALLNSYGLAGARIGDAQSVAESEVGLPIPGSQGMLIWTPKRLGSELFAQLAPMRIATSLAFMLGIAYLMRRLYQLARELEARRSDAQALATRDPLTGLGNRLAFDDGIERMLVEGMGELALFYLDLDGFKQVNDTLGHGAGDDVLRTVGQRLTALVQPSDLLIRLGGDEFVILRAEYGSSGELSRLARGIERALAEPVQLGTRALQIGVSIGIATAPADGTSGRALLEAADAALYRAKRDRTGYAMATAA